MNARGRTAPGKQALDRQSPPKPLSLPAVNISELNGVRYLHLGSEWVQGSMRLAKPNDIALEYVQRMMAWLLFVPPDAVPELHALQLGLGAGALTKFCHQRLGMRTTVVELNAQVVHACRQWFRLPHDDDRLQLVLADAGQAVRWPHWQATVDALQVDLYDEEAAAPVLDDAAFYADCRGLLKPGGCMSVNLFGRSSSFDDSLQRIVSAFGAQSVWAFEPTREGNTIVLARHASDIPERTELTERAQAVQDRWQLPAAKWAKALRWPDRGRS